MEMERNQPLSTAQINEVFESLSVEARELYLEREVTELTTVPDPLTFHRNYVCPNKPVVIRGGLDWPALTKWNHDYLKSKAGSWSVSVAVTPTGYADAVKGDYFVMPEERTTNFSHFLDIMEEPALANGVFYIQKQNSNFTEEFKDIIKDAGPDLPWATKAFGKTPDAVNFWMGDQRAVTSLHKDHYENLYCVVSGWKTFLLIAPTDLPYVPYEEYPPAQYEEVDGEFVIRGLDHLPKDPLLQFVLNVEQVPWITVDPLCPDLKKFPEFAKARCYEVTVHAGDILYLPSLWIHHVRQSHACIAVNFWYDMEFDIKYNYFKFLEKLVEAVHVPEVRNRSTATS